jgi:hypothetical protein
MAAVAYSSLRIGIPGLLHSLKILRTRAKTPNYTGEDDTAASIKIR